MAFGKDNKDIDYYAVTRKDLSILVSTDTGYAIKDVRKIVSSIFRVIPRLIIRGHKVRITGFATFTTKMRKGRKYSGLKNQPKEWQSEETRIPDMKPAKVFKGRVKETKIFYNRK